MSSLLWKMLLGAGGGAAAGPTTLILDQFTDANGTAITAHTIAPTNTPGTSWTNATGSYDIQSNQANGATFGGGSDAVATCDAGIANVDVSMIANVAATRFMGIVARFVDNSNYWLFHINETANENQLYEKTAGAYTLRDSAAMTIDASTNYTLRLIANGTTLTATVDGANTSEYTSTQHQSATRVGFRGGGAGTVRADNFTVTTV